jgi:hypothetical protein
MKKPRIAPGLCSPLPGTPASGIRKFAQYLPFKAVIEEHERKWDGIRERLFYQFANI